MHPGRHFIGTSGWHYKHWVGPFYPQDLNDGKMLEFYAQRFDTVEVNNTFYRLPSSGAVENWRALAPSHFLFAMKASRYITHMKKLKDPAGSIRRFFALTKRMGPKLGPVLFQLPPHWTANPERLDRFLKVLPEGQRYAFEFRDESWWTDRVYELLSQHEAAFCEFELAGRRSPSPKTAPFRYVRLHGPDGPYKGTYDGRTLAGWARRFRRWLNDGRDVYCYFDNDEAGHAPLDALRLKEMLERS
jgi:uncharacterized protein YecE (DUF72 family)